MNGTSKNKWLIFFIVLLLIGNAATILMFWMQRRPGPGGHRAADYIIKELNLSKSQQEQYEKMIDEHRKGADEARQHIKAAKDKLFDLLQQPSVNDSTLNTAVNNVTNETSKLELQTFHHFQKLRAICDPAQQKKFDGIIKNALDMMRPGPPGPPGHRQGEGHPPPPGE